MKISGLQKVSLIDYPGKICAVVFTQGCNFRCPYCHNPELVDPERFRACMAEEGIFSFLERRRKKLDGVTITGGEPTLQPDLENFCKHVRNLGYPVKLDTNGSHPGILMNLLDKKLIDYIAMDIKGPLNLYDSITNTKANTADIRKSIALVMESDLPYEFRTTLVASLLSEEDIIRISPLIKGARRFVLQRFQLSKCLDPHLMGNKNFDENDLEKIKGHFSQIVDQVLLR
ncbi:MAG: anaerobic ribonucleoside-triphosphate reductase activating protein [Syntrophales bacterium]|jgi:pyruvate formate lyase activating enzyme